MFARYNNSLGLWEAGYHYSSRWTGCLLFRSVYRAESFIGLKRLIRRNNT